MGDQQFAASAWLRSSQCNNGENCVEVSMDGDLIYVRNSQNTQQPPTGITLTEWTSFLAGVLRGEFEPARLRDAAARARSNPAAARLLGSEV